VAQNLTGERKEFREIATVLLPLAKIRIMLNPKDVSKVYG
jgi:hypothetical protein